MQAPAPITSVKTLAERALWARNRLDKTQQEIADAAGVSQGTIGNIESGERKKPRELVSIAAALRVRPEWLANGIGAVDPTSEFPPPVAHDMSEARNYPSLKTVSWGALHMTDLSQPFLLEVIDGAFGEEIPAGSVMRLEPGLRPRAGWPFLVRDREGRHYLRDYEQGPGSAWRAVARVKRGFAPLESVEHGLTIIAVMRGVDYFWKD